MEVTSFELVYGCTPPATHSSQVSCIFSATPRKCVIFGICYKAIPRQFRLKNDVLIDEVVNTGKGANAIVSMLHSHLEHFGLGESSLHVHADKQE